MKEEICAAVTFLTRLIGKTDNMSPEQVEVFGECLDSVLTERFQGHWFPDKPCKGQAYRCIRVNSTGRKDPVLEEAAERCGLQYEKLKLPVELTLWVDPQEVCCRFGEDEGSYCTVASFKDNKENVSGIVITDKQKKAAASQVPHDKDKRPKLRRKPFEKPSKPTAQNRQQSFGKIIPSNFRHPALLPSKELMLPHLTDFFDWSGFMHFPRNHGNGFMHPPELPFARRPRKNRPNFQNDKFHWSKQ